MTQQSNTRVSGLVIAPNGAQLWVADSRPVNIAVFASDPFAHVYVNGVDIAWPLGNPEFPGTIDELAAFDRALTTDELARLRCPSR